MADKQSIFGRIAQLTKANINSMLDSAEDPEKMLDQMIRDYKNNIAEAEEAIATTIGNVRLLEQDTNEDRSAVTEWGNKATAASAKAEELRTAGNTADADKFDKLARVALEKQIQYEGEVKDAEPAIASQNEIVVEAQVRSRRHEGQADRAAEQARQPGRPQQACRGAVQGA